MCFNRSGFKVNYRLLWEKLQINMMCFSLSYKNSLEAVNLAFTCLSRWTFTKEWSNPVMTGGTIETWSNCTVVDVFIAVGTRPAIYTDALVASVRVDAGSVITTNVRHECTLVNVLLTKLTCKNKHRQVSKKVMCALKIAVNMNVVNMSIS